MDEVGIDRAPYFDQRRQAWVVTRAADIRAVLRDTRFGTPGMRPETDTASVDTAVQPHHWWVSPAALRILRPDPHVVKHLGVLLTDRLETLAACYADSDSDSMSDEIDLMDALIRPWCHAVAATLLGVPVHVVDQAGPLARTVFIAAAYATGEPPRACHEQGQSESDAATAELARALQAYRSADAPGDGLDVQALIALTQTMPALIGAALLLLRTDPRQSMARDGGGWDNLEDLLRAAAPVRAVFRTAFADVSVGGMMLRAGARVVLPLSDARHFMFGDGPHRCAGAALVRDLFALAMHALGPSPAIRLPVDVVARSEWIEGTAIRALVRLPASIIFPT